ncbi:MAG: PIG-L family deacetylase [Acidobacteria bacterium]|nr:PIG-L family deacetylase [Acidobacteriota bacterium]
MTPPADLRGRSLLAVFAHPDDESITCGGLLAWCAHLGADVALLCLTRGEHGQDGRERGNRRAPRGQDVSRHETGAGDLARIRSRELECAARALGVKKVTLLEHADGMLPWVDAARLEADIEAAIRRQRPDAVITFDEDGVYGHPDHVAVHERATAVVAALRESAPALYYVTMPPGAMRAVADHVAQKLRARTAGPVPGIARREGRGPSTPEARGAPRATVGPRPNPTSILGVGDPDAFGAEAPAPTLVVDAGAFAAAKLDALSCHATQFHGGALEAVAPDDAPRLLGVEHYRRAAVGAAGPSFLDAFAVPAAAAGAASLPSLSDRTRRSTERPAP